MSKTNCLILSVFCIFHQSISAQADTASTSVRFVQKSILPTTLVLAGSILSGKKIEKEFAEEHHLDKEFPIDDYLQFAPIAIIYSADLMGIQAQNHWFDQSKYLFMTLALNQATVFSIKYLTNKKRPNGSPLAFPSGHTSFAFAGATVLYEEFKNTNRLLAYSGFAFATTTGVYRILNNKHWLSDVLAGAGIGILAARLIYQIQPLKNWNPFLRKHRVMVIPSYNNGFNVMANIQF